METNQINIIQLIVDASPIVQIVMLILVLLSVFGWLLIFRFWLRLSSANRTDAEFEQNFWSGANLKVLYQHATNKEFSENLEGVFADGFTEHLKLARKDGVTDTSEGMQRTLRVSLQRKQASLENGLSALASIGSVSPYIGLFGTVWGIMNAFIGLSAASQATLSSVAPGIAEALIATAMGLFAAIPAVLAFNHFTAKAERIYTARALFCEELVGLIARESKPVSSKAGGNGGHMNSDSDNNSDNNNGVIVRS